MGSGKTRTALEAARLVGAECVVIIAPPIALRMWAREARDHLTLPAQVIKTGASKIDPLAQILIMSYEIATKRAEELKRIASPLAKSVLIVDESHAPKSIKAKRTQATHGFGGLCSAFPHSWRLPGPPSTPRHADEGPF